MKVVVVLLILICSACASTRGAGSTGYTCASGNAAVCLKQAKKYYQGDGVSRDLKRARMYAKKGCELDDAESCVFVGYIYSKEKSQAGHEAAFRYYDRSCKMASQQGCFFLASSYLRARGVPRDTKRGMALLAKGCEAEYARACWGLGQSYLTNERIPPDRKKAASYFERGCALGGAASCATLSTGSLIGPRVLSNKTSAHKKKMYRYAKRACALDDAESCVRQYRYLAGGIGVQKDAAQAAKQLSTMCPRRSTNACVQLAYLKARGAGVEKNLKEAVQIMRITCTAENYNACSFLGSWFDQERFVDFDIDEAIVLYRRGCKGNSMFSCINLGLIYQDGRGVKAEPIKAAGLFKKACDVGVPYGCINYAAGMLTGKLKGDKNTAIKTLERQCAQGVSAGCTVLARQYLEGVVVKRDVPRGTRMVEKECTENKFDKACYVLGKLLYEQDKKTRARTLLVPLCEDSDAEACMLLIEDKALTVNIRNTYLALAKKHHSKSCRLLYVKSCAALKTLPNTVTESTKGLNPTPKPPTQPPSSTLKQ